MAAEVRLVKIRVSGPAAAVERVSEWLCHGPQVEEVSLDYPNRGGDRPPLPDGGGARRRGGPAVSYEGRSRAHAAAIVAADAVREINHITIGSRWAKSAAEVYDVLGSLSHVAARLPQTTSQLAGYLMGQQEDGRLRGMAAGPPMSPSSAPSPSWPRPASSPTCCQGRWPQRSAPSTTSVRRTAMTTEVRVVIPDWVTEQAIRVAEGLPLLAGAIETEYVGEGQEDRETGPAAEEEPR